MPFTSNLGNLMSKKNLTYEDLQFLSRVAPDTVARAKDARIETCQLKTLEKIADALDVDVAELFRWQKREEEVA